MSTDDVKKRLAATGRLLVRSATEITRILESMRADGDPVTASIESGEVLFMSRLLRVEPAHGFMVLAWSSEKHSNLALLGEGVVTFRCNHRGAHYEFAGGAARETQHAGEPAIQLTLPVALVATERRTQARTPVPPRVPLRCDLPLGPASLAASVVDMTLGGMGSLLYDASVGIEPGTPAAGSLPTPGKSRS